MDSMKIYLTAIAADALNTAQVNFDTVSTEEDTETTGTTTTTLNIIGATSLKQLKENIESIDCKLNEEILKEIDKVHKVYTYPCP